jgi:hypothetical protein
MEAPAPVFIDGAVFIARWPAASLTVYYLIVILNNAFSAQVPALMTTPVPIITYPDRYPSSSVYHRGKSANVRGRAKLSPFAR